MVNKFLDYITIALYNHFGSDYTYYVEDVEQNFEKPSFTILPLNPTIRSTSPTRYHRTIPLVIHFFTEKESSNEARKDNFAVAEKLMEALEYLQVESYLFRGERISYEEVEGVLQFFITYEFDTTRELEETFIETATLNGVPV